MFKFIKDGKIVGVSDEPFRGKRVGNFNGSCKGGSSIDEQIEDTEHTVDDYVEIDWQYVLKTSDEAIEQRKVDVRSIRNQYLEQTDKYMISDFPVSKDEKAKYKAYRQYLRDYTEQEDWWENNPLTFEVWKDEQ